MKKTVTGFLLTGLLLWALLLPACAQAQLDYVTDQAGLLTSSEKEELEGNAAYLARVYGLGVYIITVDDITDYVSAYDMESAAEELYLRYSLGEHEDRSGILLLLNMDSREWALFAFGYGNVAFTDYGKQYLSGFFLDDFGENEWYGGLEDYQTVCGEMVDLARQGEAVDVHSVPVSGAGRLLGVAACILLGLIPALIVTGILRFQLRSVAQGTDADRFAVGGGLVILGQNDVYTHTTTTRTYSPQSKSSSSGGTSIRSSGGSSASGHF